MREIELSAGTIEYSDTGGDGPVIVLLHGLMMDASLWDGPIADLSAGYRCVAPTLPLGAHRRAMHAGADLSLPGIARLVAEFLDRLDLRDVTLVGNDTGGALVQGGAWPGSSLTDSWPRWQTATPSSPWTSQRDSPGSSGSSLTQPRQPSGRRLRVGSYLAQPLARPTASRQRA
jgi:hypothetical protein